MSLSKELANIKNTIRPDILKIEHFLFLHNLTKAHLKPSNCLVCNQEVDIKKELKNILLPKLCDF